jgi:hypothetical protein
VRDQISHPYQTTGKITVLYKINLYIIEKKTGKQKILDQKVATIPDVQLAVSFFMNGIMILQGFSPNI